MCRRRRRAEFWNFFLTLNNKKKETRKEKILKVITENTRVEPITVNE